MVKKYHDEIISKWMMNDVNIKIVCQNLIGHKLPENSIYTYGEINKEQLRYSISKDMNDEIVNEHIIGMDDLYTIVKSEMRDIKLNELGL